MAISMLKIRRPLGRLIFNMGIAIPGKTVFLIETAPRLRWIMLLISNRVICKCCSTSDFCMTLIVPRWPWWTSMLIFIDLWPETPQPSRQFASNPGFTPCALLISNTVYKSIITTDSPPIANRAQIAKLMGTTWGQKGPVGPRCPMVAP